MASKEKKLSPYSLFHIYLTALFVFFLPIKFGSMVGVPEIPLSWRNILSWLLENCPPIFFPILASVLFISAFIANNCNKNIPLNIRSSIPVLWLFLAAASFIGFLNASTLDFPLTYALHFSGLAIFAFAALLTLQLSENADKIMLRALIAGNCAVLFFSLHQLLFGFENTIEFIREKEAQSGVKVSRDLWLRIVQTRVFAPFALCNSLAANIILTLPVISCGTFFDKNSGRLAVAVSALSLFLIFSGSFGTAGMLISVFIFSFIIAALVTRFYDEYWKWICRSFSVIFTIFALYILKHTFSRGAVVALGLSLFSVPIFLKINPKLKAAYIAAMAIIFVTFFALVNQDRAILGHSSLHVRVDYWLRAGEIFLANPLSGTGWGDFFHDYTVIKKFPGTEAPHSSHNMVMDFAAQCGLLGLAAICLTTILPLLFSARAAAKAHLQDFSPYASLSIFCGLLAWSIHSLTDINFQVPGTIASAIILSIVSAEKSSFKFINFGTLKFANFAILLLAFPLLFFSIQRAMFEAKFDKLHRISDPILMDDADSQKYSLQAMESALRQAVKAAPYSPFPWASAGLYAQNRGLWDLSEKYFNLASKKSPERASFHYRLALSQLQQGKFSAAVKNLKNAAELFPNNQEYQELYRKIKNIIEEKN